jgi:hypothetical protein
MRNKRYSVARILVLATALAFSACQQSAADNLDISHSLVAAPTPTATPVMNSPIRNIDFKNFTYPMEGSAHGSFGDFKLEKGEVPFIKGEQNGIYFVLAEYADLTGDGNEEAFVNLSITTGGSYIPNVIYIFTMEREKPRLLWSFETGDRAEGGFKRIYAENGELIVETFGENKFENGKWKFGSAKYGLANVTEYTKIRFQWNGKKFIAIGKPELFEYDFKNPEKAEPKTSQN